ncbi:MAG: hypothetical protein E3J37_09665 [Anaerolineales bacterium]|nr:MAG: hypothetical protein E3J37_09665 [Anaerolineales bacterium]
MSEQALEAHLENQEQRPPEEMVEVEKDYLEWLEAERKRLQESVMTWCKHSQVAWSEVTRLRELQIETLRDNG